MSNLKFVLFVGACLCLVFASGARALGQSNPDDPEPIFDNAVRLHKSGDFEGAIRGYQAFLARRPDRVDALSNLGAAYAHLGRIEEAITEYNRALDVDPGNSAVRFNLSLAYYKSARFQEAATDLRKVVKADPQNRNALLALADCEFRFGEYQKVVDLLSPQDAAGKGDHTSDYLLGTALMAENKIDEGKIYLDRILREGDSAQARVLMGSVQMSVKDFSAAIKEFQKAVELGPSLPTLHSLYGRALLAAGDRNGALEAFKKELEVNPTDYDANAYIGMMLKQDEKYQEALGYIERAWMIRPGNPDTRYYLGSIYLALGRTPEAVPLLEQSVKESPDFIEAHIALATAYYRLKRKADGDNERAVILKLNAEKQALQPASKENPGQGYRGEPPQPTAKSPKREERMPDRR
ncbi:MAG TPA: tetratricopeptide repeat protein [Blastocatellia bacterium]|nr:tetratricopeptide repeat protein [Blastocatellia bacterium]